MKKIIPLVLAAFALFVLSSCQEKKQVEEKNIEIHYSAAASLKDALTDIKTDFEKENPNLKVQLDFGGSGALREKVLAGAPIDGVLFASKKDTDALVKADKLENPTIVLKNTLVLITNKKNNFSDDLLTTLKIAQKIAIGKPETVPAGNYAKQTLTTLNILPEVENKLVQGSDVRQVLAFVEAGNADCGFVYETDAKLSDDVKILAKVPADLHQEILYYTGSVKNSTKKDTVQKFNDFLSQDTSQKILKNYGFTPAN